MNISHKPKCSTAVICCIDFRFWEATVNFVKNSLGIADFDLITHAGSAQGLAENEADVITTLEKHGIGVKS